MPNIFDYIKAEEIAAYIDELPSNKIPLVAETLFPQKKQIGTDISWLKGSQGLPVAITPSNYDTKATLRERTGFGKMETEMAFFREATRIGEKDRQEINKLLNHPNSNLALPIINKIFDDVARLAEGVRIQAEVMRMQLLQTGAVEVANRDRSARYAYDFNQQNFYDVAVPWTTGATSDPVKDIIAVLDDMEDKCGVRPTRGLLNRKTYLDMVASESIKRSLMIGVAGNVEDLYLSESQILNVIEQRTGVKFKVYSKKIAKLNDDLVPDMAKANLVKLMEDDRIVIMPDGALGHTWFGTTPEESDLMSGASQADCSITGLGAAITTYKEVHPVNVVTVVSAVIMPSFEKIDEVAVLRTV